MLIVVLQVVIMFGVSSAVFGMSLGNSLLGLGLVTLGLAPPAKSLGLLLAGLAKNGKQADSVGTVMGFVLGGVGGCIPFGPTPLYRQEGFMGRISRFTPHAQALEGFTRLMREGAGPVDVLPQAGILFAMGALCLLIAVWRFKYE